MHRRLNLRLFLAAFALLLALPSPAAVSHGFRVPDGFEVSLYAGDDLAHDIYAMTLDHRGRVVVASKGWVKILHDTDGDGKADRATVFSEFPKSGTRGMYFDATGLVLTGDGGVRRWRDTDGDDKADGEPELFFRTERDGEHAANGIVKGPDGWFYLIAGNDAGITSAHAKLPGSPVKQPNAGALVRFSPDGKSSEILAHGFRNPYDLDFHPLGQVFTYDADGERDHHLPWYAGTRIFDIATGSHHGWVLRGWQHAWSRPEAWPDNTPRLATIGRGSPTGVFVYRHHAFPERYRGGVFAVCWTMGRIYYCPLTRDGSSFRTTLETFLEGTGENGFAPVDAAVAPNGDVFVAIGGRGTLGSVFRIHYTGKLPTPNLVTNPMRLVLSAPQPLSSWSRAKWVPQAKALGAAAFEQAALNPKLPLLERIRAVEVLVELFAGLRPETARALTRTGEPELTARVAWAVGVVGQPSRLPLVGQASSPATSPSVVPTEPAPAVGTTAPLALLAELTQSNDPRIARAAWEALQSVGADVRRLHPNGELGMQPPNLSLSLLPSAPTPDWFRGLNSDDRRVRAATVLAARGAGRGSFAAAPVPARLTGRQRLGLLAIHGPTRPDAPDWTAHYFHNAAFVAATERDAVTRLDAVRLLQLALGDVKLVQDKPDTYDGFAAARTEEVPAALRREVIARLAPAFPTGDADLDRELGRLLGMLSADAPGLLAHVAAKLTDTSPVEDDIHFLMVAARLPSPRTPDTTAQLAHAIAGLHHKMNADKKEPSRFWPVRVGDMFSRLLERDAALAPALLAAPNFNLADHALFAGKLPYADRPAAARALLGRVQGPWSREFVELLTPLPDAELFPALRGAWTQPALHDALASTLARSPQPEDRARFVATLGSFQPAAVERAARALGKFAGSGEPTELAAALTALRRLCQTPKESSARSALANLLAVWSKANFPVTEGADLLKSYAPWFEWFTQTHPAAAKELVTTDEDLGAWAKRLAAVNWDAGNAPRGERIYTERMCLRCHGGTSRVGPDLTGVATRMSRDDLFTAILDPNRDISPTWQAKLFTTKSGATHLGLVIYESPTAKLVQTGPDTTVRFTGDEVVSVAQARTSLMPAGLLAGLKDEELADFYAFVKTLRK